MQLTTTKTHNACVPGVTAAIAELAAYFGPNHVDVTPTDCGGALVEVSKVPLGDAYEQEDTWVGFFLTSACPEADVYPFYVRADLKRKDGAELKAPLHKGRMWPDGHAGSVQRTAVMISRRQNNRNGFGIESPLRKLRHVMSWLRAQ